MALKRYNESGAKPTPVGISLVYYLINAACLSKQCAKKVVSDSLGLVDFALGLMIFVLNLPDGQVLFWGKFKLQKDCNQSCQSKRVWC